MREYITLADIRDEILDCAEADVAAACAFIEQAAGRLEVRPDDIADPAPLVIKRLGECFACYNRALLKVGTDSTSIFDGARGAEGKDIYVQKVKLYRAEIDRLTASLTAADFTGERGKGGRVISLGRA
jgi:hypothetical protein